MSRLRKNIAPDLEPFDGFADRTNFRAQQCPLCSFGESPARGYNLCSIFEFLKQGSGANARSDFAKMGGRDHPPSPAQRMENTRDGLVLRAATILAKVARDRRGVSTLAFDEPAADFKQKIRELLEHIHQGGGR